LGVMKRKSRISAVKIGQDKRSKARYSRRQTLLVAQEKLSRVYVSERTGKTRKKVKGSRGKGGKVKRGERVAARLARLKKEKKQDPPLWVSNMRCRRECLTIVGPRQGTHCLGEPVRRVRGY